MEAAKPNGPGLEMVLETFQVHLILMDNVVSRTGYNPKYDSKNNEDVKIMLEGYRQPEWSGMFSWEAWTSPTGNPITGLRYQLVEWYVNLLDYLDIFPGLSRYSMHEVPLEMEVPDKNLIIHQHDCFLRKKGGEDSES